MMYESGWFCRRGGTVAHLYRLVPGTKVLPPIVSPICGTLKPSRPSALVEVLPAQSRTCKKCARALAREFIEPEAGPDTGDRS